jgi:hypothetical protein
MFADIVFVVLHYGAIGVILWVEEFLWENKWVEETHEGDGANLCTTVDEAFGATQSLRGWNLPRSAAAATSSRHHRTYVRTRKHPRNAAAQDIREDNSGHQDDGPAAVEKPLQVESSPPIEEGSESNGETTVGDAYAFHLDEDMLL